MVFETTQINDTYKKDPSSLKLPTNIIRHIHLFLLLFIPFAALADGQDGLVIIWDSILFVVVFAFWAAVVFPVLYSLNKSRAKKISGPLKLFTILGTALIALFIWLMIKSDPYPYDGPIDSIIYKEQNERMKQAAMDNLINGYPDSTIVETIAALDTSQIGIYIWLNQKSVFVRKDTPKFESQREKDAYTMAIVRGWKKQQ